MGGDGLGCACSSSAHSVQVFIVGESLLARLIYADGKGNAMTHPKTKRDNLQISVYLGRETLAELEALAEKEHRNRANMAWVLIHEAMEARRKIRENLNAMAC